MVAREITLGTPQENILFDEVLLALAEKNGCLETLRFWESPVSFIVLGKISKLQDDINLETVQKDKIPILRRCSGGGTVMQGCGCLNYALILSKEKRSELSKIPKSYAWIIGQLIKVFKELNIRAIFQPISDIATLPHFRKFSGNAQRRARKFILHHGTILYAFDILKIERYLRRPQMMPDYRKQRAHRDFLINVPLVPEKFKQSCGRIFQATQGDNKMTQEESALLKNLVQQKKTAVDVGSV
ncbi:MAG: lipoate--protein ligase family protein [Candidatus Omnitrophota bacterium]